MIKYLVWIKNQYGVPEAHLWFGEQIDGNGKVKETLSKQELHPSEHSIGIRELANRYPYKQT